MAGQRHRGKHPRDDVLFARERHPALRAATSELSWLLTRGYAEVSALKLVGDRHALSARQRKAVLRCACDDAARDARVSRRRELAELSGQALCVDGFNLLITVESLLSGGFVFVGRDRAHRDLASVHGTYRMVSETDRALALLGAMFSRASIAPVTWYLDRPVSNSGRLRARLLEIADREGWDWYAALVDDPDPELAAQPTPVATSDSWILDRCRSWVDLPSAIVGDPPPPLTDAKVSVSLVNLSDPRPP